MATKTLRTSGGDFSTLDAWITYLQSLPAFTEPEILNVQAGQFFTGGQYYSFSGPGKYILSNGFDIIIQTDPSHDIDLLGPGAIQYDSLAVAPSTSDPGNTSGRTVLQKIIFVGPSGGNAFGIGADTGTFYNWLFKNSWILFRGEFGGKMFDASAGVSGGVSNFDVVNSSILSWYQSQGDTAGPNNTEPLGELGFTSSTFDNNIFYTFHVLNLPNFSFDADSSRGPVNIKNNTWQDYKDGLAASFTGLAGGSQSGGLFGNINHSVPLLQSENESIATVVARIQAGASKLTGTENLIIDNANAVSAPGTDYLGNTRPQNAADDRGPSEFLNPNAPPAINLLPINQRPLNRAGQFDKSPINISYLLVDENSDLASLTKDGSTPGYEFAIGPNFFSDTSATAVMTTLDSDALHDGVIGLVTSPAVSGGEQQTFVWDACKDIETLLGRTIVDVETFSVKIRLQAHDGTDPGGPTTSNKFNIRCGLRSPSSTKTKDIAQHFGRLNWR